MVKKIARGVVTAKTTSIRFRVTEEQKKILAKRAAKEGESLSSWLLRVALRTAGMAILLALCLMGCGRFLDAGTVVDRADAATAPELVGMEEDRDGGELPDQLSIPRDAVSDGSDGVPASFTYAPLTSSPIFSDDFNRSDSTTIGNGWFERVPEAFSISSGTVESLLQGGTDQLVRREEMRLDLELSADLIYGAYDEPSLYARLTSSELPQSFEGYRAWFYATHLSIQYRSAAGGIGEIEQANILPAMVVGRRYRIYLRVVGTDPVELSAAVYDDAGGLMASVRTLHEAPTRFVFAGRYGFGSRKPTTRWDAFWVR